MITDVLIWHQTKNEILDIQRFFWYEPVSESECIQKFTKVTFFNTEPTTFEGVNSTAHEKKIPKLFSRLEYTWHYLIVQNCIAFWLLSVPQFSILVYKQISTLNNKLLCHWRPQKKKSRGRRCYFCCKHNQRRHISAACITLNYCNPDLHGFLCLRCQVHC